MSRDAHSEATMADTPALEACPDHPEAVLEMGYGLAGGGVGLYSYCPVCSRIISKTQDRDGDDNG